MVQVCDLDSIFHEFAIHRRQIHFYIQNGCFKLITQKLTHRCTARGRDTHTSVSICDQKQEAFFRLFSRGSWLAASSRLFSFPFERERAGIGFTPALATHTRPFSRKSQLAASSTGCSARGQKLEATSGHSPEACGLQPINNQQPFYVLPIRQNCFQNSNLRRSI